MKKLSLIMPIFYLMNLNAYTTSKECVTIASVKIGDKFSTYDSKTLDTEIKKECIRLNCSKYEIEKIKVTHPKFGNSYYATGELFQCK
jgi:electron transfer flavoprotein alpha subunit